MPVYVQPVVLQPLIAGFLKAYPDIHIELTRGGTQLSVRWPSTQADSCAAWLRELAATALKE